MYRNLVIAGAAGLLAAGAAMAADPPNTVTPMPQVQAKMKSVVDEASTGLFTTASEADPENGPDQKLPNAAGWAKVKAQADALKAVGDMLQDPTVGKTTEANWMQDAKAMSDLSAAASKAAASKNAKALAQAANDLSDRCTSCHKIYKNQ